MSRLVKKSFAKKSLGQNFLIDQNYIERIISALDPKSDETIVEIGAGRGALTKQIVGKAGKVIAIELDRVLITGLQKEFASYENFVVIAKDALEIDYQSLPSLQSAPSKNKLVANLPYYISTAILQYLFQFRSSFSELILMLQKEVVERITAKTETRERGYLTVLIETYFDTEKLFDVPPAAFRPKPKIWSSVVRLVPREAEIGDEELYREIVSLGFMQKRKTIQNNLKNAKGNLLKLVESQGGTGVILKEVGIDAKRRAESISLEEWQALADFINKTEK